MFGFGRTKELERQVAELSQALTVQNSSQSMEGWESWQSVLDGFQTDAGVTVNSNTAMRSSAVYRCVSVNAGAVAAAPCPIFRFGTRDKVPDHPLWKVLNSQPSPNVTASVFWKHQTAALQLKGDAFAYIHRNNNGVPLGLYRLDPNRMTVCYADDVRIGPRRAPDGFDIQSEERFYAYNTVDGRTIGLDQNRVMHVPGVGFDGLRGMSPIAYAARQAVGLALAAEEYSAKFFGNGATPSIILEAPGKLTDEQIEQLRNVFQKKYGGLDNSRLPMVMANGIKHSQLAMNSNDAQLIESRTFQVLDICRIFGVPPHMAGETTKASSFGSGINDLSIGHTKYTIAPILGDYEQELNSKLFPNDDFFCEFNTDGLLRGDAAARTAFYSAALGGSSGPAFMTPNEVRELENLPPIEGGDTLVDWQMGRPAEASQ